MSSYNRGNNVRLRVLLPPNAALITTRRISMSLKGIQGASNLKEAEEEQEDVEPDG